jgi:hypothetical protein
MFHHGRAELDILGQSRAVLGNCNTERAIASAVCVLVERSAQPQAQLPQSAEVRIRHLLILEIQAVTASRPEDVFHGWIAGAAIAPCESVSVGCL